MSQGNDSDRAQLRLPDFIGVGPMRTATTWLHEQFKKHAGLPRWKELRFFDLQYDRGLEWYAAHFVKSSPNLPAGEFDPNYFAVPHVVERIARDIPGCKIVVTLRHPVERAYSHYKAVRHDSWLGEVTFEDALKENGAILANSRYASCLRRWQQYFPNENVGVFLYEDLRANEKAYLDRLCDFIGVAPFAPVELKKRTVNAFELQPKNPMLSRLGLRILLSLRSRQFYRTISLLDRTGFFEFCHGRGEPFPGINREAADRIVEELLPEIDARERILGRDLSAWKQPPYGLLKEASSMSSRKRLASV
jgi:hypothetical protein